MTTNDYPSVRLGEVLQLAIDAVPIDPSASYQISGVYSFGRGLLARAPLLGTETTYKVLHRLHKDDFVLSQLKGWEGALARVNADFDGWFLSPQFPTFRTIPERLDISYLTWYCKQTKVWEELRGKARGMGARRDSVSPEQLFSLKIPLPPLAEQRRIVARIEELAAKIEEARGLRRESVEAVKALAPAILAQGYDEATRIAEGTERLGNLCYVITDGTHATPIYVEEGIPFLSVKDITTGVIRFDDTKYITLEDHAILTKRCKPERDDVLLTKVGTTGFAKIIDVDQEFSIFVSLALLKLDKTRLNSKYTEYMLNSARLREYSAAGTRGVGNKNLVLKFIKEFPMPAPPLSEQLRIVAFLDSLLTKVNTLKAMQAETAAELDTLLPAVLDRAFKGEL